MARSITALALLSLTFAVPRSSVADAPERRAALLALADDGPAATPELQAALNDENAVCRRTAARMLARLGTPALDALGAALANSDFVVRLIALRGLVRATEGDTVPHLATAMADESALIRRIAITELAAIEPRDDRVSQLIEAAAKDESDGVREVAARALWPFHREVTSIRDRKDWDHVIEVAQAIDLPLEGWRFALDPGRDGHTKGWYKPGFDDSAWEQLAVGKSWEEQGHPYDGVAWYRATFPLPGRPEHLAAELRFGGVDECAWVWVNGVYVGQHDIGPEGWDKPFTLDVTAEATWGADNQITVRVFDSKFAGGIWKPVTLEVLQ